MGRIAWGRVIFGGIVAGVLFNAFEFLLHGRMLGVAWHTAMVALGKTPEEIAASQATSMPILLLWAFLACLFGVWLYAAIRPRFGAGPRTALMAAVATWFGVTLLPAPGDRLWTLNAVNVPGGLDEAAVRRRLLEQSGIEIGAGLGPLAGRIWRVGLMGDGSTLSNVVRFLAALEDAMRAVGHPPQSSSDAIDAAESAASSPAEH